MSIGQRWMIEVVGGIPHHADPLHDPSGAVVAGHRERDDLGHIERVEPKPEDRTCAFGRVPMTPMLRRDAPAYLHTRRKVRNEPWDGEADESGEWRDTGNLQRPQSEAVLLEVMLYARHEPIALFTRQQAGEELHHSRIGVHGREGAPVAGTPAAQV